MIRNNPTVKEVFDSMDRAESVVKQATNAVATATAVIKTVKERQELLDLYAQRAANAPTVTDSSAASQGATDRAESAMDAYLAGK